ncbi:tyrosine-protein phosphatase [Dyadobacter subterraneus]|uniref:Tyrosine-protein phosphatase n=1 Tax=Dyadobacter subterraneus TaxID=2773304 RepID=A0ABR9W7W1_9BACT|nr:tyrosine-protein phosphatase [Dyadobacter subterraneus]MBE9461557.1 tyrosine-protein phosphatase [Dyadobacter subterraneus]
MKNLFLLFYFSLLFSSCSVKLPKSYSEKSLKEENYLENYRNNYTLHFNKSTVSEINLQNTPNLFKWNKTDDPVLLKDYKTRPYFNLISKSDTITVSNRHIDFKNVINFRDIGGIKTMEGKTVRWGKIFRSDNLAGLKKSEFRKFNDLHIQTVYDLRTANEIKGKEDKLPENVNYVHFSTVKDNGDLLAQLKNKVINGEISEEKSIELTLELYTGCVSENLPTVRTLLQKVLASDEPVLYHCSAGKDRTGMTTALILSILKVDRKTIMDEYLLSNYYRKDKIEKMLGKVKLAKVVKRHINTKVIENFMKVDERYLNATFEVIDKKYGGMDKFIKNELQIDDKSRNELIRKLTY